MRILLVLLVACGSPSSPPPVTGPGLTSGCEDTWLLLHSVYGCADKRTGVSGYRVLEVVDGVYRGWQVVAAYNEMCRASITDWNLTGAAFGPVENECAAFVGDDCRVPTVDGVVRTWEAGAIEAYSDEASARAAREQHCASQ